MGSQIWRNKWFIVSIALLLVLIVYIIVYPPGSGNKSGGLADSAEVARVNGVSISKEQLYEAMLKLGGAQTLDNLITEELLQQELEKAGIEVTEADIDKEIATIKQNFSDEEFSSMLAMYGMTEEQLRSEMTTQAQLRKLLEPQVSVTDEDVKAYYDENLDSLKTPEQVRASHILTETKEEAEAILAELKGGADFAETAKAKSTDTATKDNGGDLDFFAKGEMEEPFEEAAFALEVGQLSDVVETSNGFHIIQLTDRKAETTPTLDEKKEEIRQQLIEEEIYKLSSTWLEDTRAAADIRNTLEDQ